MAPDVAYEVPWAATLACNRLAETLPDAEVALQVTDLPEHLTVTVPPPVPLDLLACRDGAGPARAEGTFNITATAALLAETPHDVFFQATSGPINVNAGMAVEALYAGQFNVTAPRTQARGAPQSILHFPIHVAANANGPTRIDFETERAAEGMIVLPHHVILQAGEANGSEMTVNVSYSTPFENGYMEASEPVVVTVTATSSASGVALAEPVTVHLQAETKGWYVPSPGAAAMIGLLALAAVARRKS